MPAGNPRQRLAEAEALIGRGDIPAARAALRELMAQAVDAQAREQAALRVVEQFMLADFREAAAVLRGHAQRPDAEPVVLANYAYACFAMEDFAESVRAARAALARLPEDGNVARTLGMALLAQGQPADAFMAFSTAMLPAALAGQDAGVTPFRTLALKLMQGERTAAFRCDGEEFRFHLRVDNGSMIEAALHHLHGSFTEMEELRLVRERVRSCRSLVEVGTLVGNHLVYFLKTLKPERALAIDISARSIEATRDNVQLNAGGAGGPEVGYRPIGIARARGTTTGPAGEVAQVMPLDEAVAGEVDFLKIDVDGLEIETLEGAAGTLAKYRPRVLIEIARENDPAFHAFLARAGYQAAAHIDRGMYRNYLIEAR